MFLMKLGKTMLYLKLFKEGKRLVEEAEEILLISLGANHHLVAENIRDLKVMATEDPSILLERRRTEKELRQHEHVCTQCNKRKTGPTADESQKRATNKKSKNISTNEKIDEKLNKNQNNSSTLEETNKKDAKKLNNIKNEMKKKSSKKLKKNLNEKILDRSKRSTKKKTLDYSLIYGDTSDDEDEESEPELTDEQINERIARILTKYASIRTGTTWEKTKVNDKELLANEVLNGQDLLIESYTPIDGETNKENYKISPKPTTKSEQINSKKSKTNSNFSLINDVRPTEDLKVSSTDSRSSVKKNKKLAIENFKCATTNSEFNHTNCASLSDIEAVNNDVAENEINDTEEMPKTDSNIMSVNEPMSKEPIKIEKHLSKKSFNNKNNSTKKESAATIEELNKTTTEEEKQEKTNIHFNSKVRSNTSPISIRQSSLNKDLSTANLKMNSRLKISSKFLAPNKEISLEKPKLTRRYSSPKVGFIDEKSKIECKIEEIFKRSIKNELTLSKNETCVGKTKTGRKFSLNEEEMYKGKENLYLSLPQEDMIQESNQALANYSTTQAEVNIEKSEASLKYSLLTEGTNKKKSKSNCNSVTKEGPHKHLDTNLACSSVFFQETITKSKTSSNDLLQKLETNMSSLLPYENININLQNFESKITYNNENVNEDKRELDTHYETTSKEEITPESIHPNQRHLSNADEVAEEKLGIKYSSQNSEIYKKMEADTNYNKITKKIITETKNTNPHYLANKEINNENFKLNKINLNDLSISHNLKEENSKNCSLIIEKNVLKNREVSPRDLPKANKINNEDLNNKTKYLPPEEIIISNESQTINSTDIVKTNEIELDDVNGSSSTMDITLKNNSAHLKDTLKNKDIDVSSAIKEKTEENGDSIDQQQSECFRIKPEKTKKEQISDLKLDKLSPPKEIIEDKLKLCSKNFFNNLEIVQEIPDICLKYNKNLSINLNNSASIEDFNINNSSLILEVSENEANSNLEYSPPVKEENTLDKEEEIKRENQAATMSDLFISRETSMEESKLVLNQEETTKKMPEAKIECSLLTKKINAEDVEMIAKLLTPNKERITEVLENDSKSLLPNENTIIKKMEPDFSSKNQTLQILIPANDNNEENFKPIKQQKIFDTKDISSASIETISTNLEGAFSKSLNFNNTQDLLTKDINEEKAKLKPSFSNSKILNIEPYSAFSETIKADKTSETISNSLSPSKDVEKKSENFVELSNEEIIINKLKTNSREFSDGEEITTKETEAGLKYSMTKEKFNEQKETIKLKYLPSEESNYEKSIPRLKDALSDDDACKKVEYTKQDSSPNKRILGEISDDKPKYSQVPEYDDQKVERKISLTDLCLEQNLKSVNTKNAFLESTPNICNINSQKLKEDIKHLSNTKISEEANEIGANCFLIKNQNNASELNQELTKETNTNDSSFHANKYSTNVHINENTQDKNNFTLISKNKINPKNLKTNDEISHVSLKPARPPQVTDPLGNGSSGKDKLNTNFQSQSYNVLSQQKSKLSLKSLLINNKIKQTTKLNTNLLSAVENVSNENIITESENFTIDKYLKNDSGKQVTNEEKLKIDLKLLSPNKKIEETKLNTDSNKIIKDNSDKSKNVITNKEDSENKLSIPSNNNKKLSMETPKIKETEVLPTNKPTYQTKPKKIFDFSLIYGNDDEKDNSETESDCSLTEEEVSERIALILSKFSLAYGQKGQRNAKTTLKWLTSRERKVEKSETNINSLSTTKCTDEKEFQLNLKYCAIKEDEISTKNSGIGVNLSPNAGKINPERPLIRYNYSSKNFEITRKDSKKCSRYSTIDKLDKEKAKLSETTFKLRQKYAFLDEELNNEKCEKCKTEWKHLLNNEEVREEKPKPKLRMFDTTMGNRVIVRY